MSFVQIIKLLLLVLAFLGYVCRLSKKIRPEFSIGITFAAAGSIMFFSGILNIMHETAMAILLVGLYFLLASFKEKDTIKSIITPGTVFFAIMCVYLFIVMNGSLFLHDDNFSHWAVAAKSLIENNRYPNFTNPLNFYSYPLGSTAFIYLFAHICSIQAEWFQAYAQTVLMAGMMTGIFAFAKKRTGNIMAAIAIIVLMCGNIAFNDLLVDTLLPVAAVGATAFCIYYEKDLNAKLVYLVPYTVFMMSIKNSGVFFVIIVMAYVLFNIEKSKNAILRFAVSAACPAAAIFLWQRFVKMAYGYAGFYGNHSMTPEYYKMIFGLKTFDDVKNILLISAKKIISLNNPVLFIVAAAVAVIILCRIAIADKQIIKITLFAVISYVVYQIGIVGTYIFSMTNEEAYGLAAYDRYHKTILIFVGAILVIAVLKIISSYKCISSKDKTLKIVIAVGAVLMVCFALKPDFSSYLPQNLPENHERIQVKKLISENDAKKEKSCVLVTDGTANHYLASILMFELQPSEFDMVSVYDLKDTAEELLQDKDYIIAFDGVEDIEKYMQNKYSVKTPIIVNISE